MSKNLKPFIDTEQLKWTISVIKNTLIHNGAFCCVNGIIWKKYHRYYFFNTVKAVKYVKVPQTSVIPHILEVYFHHLIVV